MKPHFTQSKERLIEGKDITAACGTIVSNATWAFMLDREAGVLDGLTLASNSLRDCMKCLQIIEDTAFKAQGPRYIYAIVSGEESIHEAA